MIDIIGKKGEENKVRFSFYREGKLYYDVIKNDVPTWTFPVDVTDVGDIGRASFCAEHKAIRLMRYIRKAMENDELEKLTLD